MTILTTSSERSVGNAIPFADRSEAELEIYLDKLNLRIGTATTRGEIDILNSLWWRIWFAIADKKENHRC